ncbi:MAG: HPr family phosphocarrier protein [Oscillospiraceae bacterium]|nr:HPr family phosphocarrier protein [Oscillospiraceae bacterium]
MKEFRYVIKDEVGIHARPAGKLVKLASNFKSIVTIQKADKNVDCKRLFGIMGLGIKCGDEILIKVDGPDEDIAVLEIEKFFNENL